jgi:hypothetical protein
VTQPVVSLACDIRADGAILQGNFIQLCELKGENEYLLTWKVPFQGEARTHFSAEAGIGRMDAHCGRFSSRSNRFVRA